MYFFLNGSFLVESEAKLSVLDLGIIRGFGVFDYLRTYRGKPFHLKEHLQRLQYSATNLGLTIPYSFEEIEDIVHKLLKLNQSSECSLKLLVTGGVSSDQMIPSGKGFFAAFAYPLSPYPREYYEKGIKTITSSHQRCLPDCKTTQYLPAILSLQEGRKKGALESLYLNEKKEILEATTSNFFAIKDNVLITPPEQGILLGITRSVVLRVCQGHFPIEVRSISQEEIPFLDEAFITASNKEVMPVIQINDTLIKDGTVGPCTKKILNLFDSYTKQDHWELLEIPRYSSCVLLNT